MVILGINHFFHDTSACVVVDGRLVVAIEEERLSRRKHTNAFPELAVRRCLEVAGIESRDVAHVAVSVAPTLYWPRKLAYGLRHAAHLRPFADHELVRAYYKQRALHDWYRRLWPEGARAPKLHFVEHHLAHVAGSFLVSPYEEAALLCLDGAGEWGSAWLGHGRDREVRCFGKSFFPHSLGSFYEAVTEFCGFKPNYDEGKTMGLAPFGDPERFRGVVDRMVRVSADGELQVDLSYFNYQYAGHRRCGRKFIETFGTPRPPGGEFEAHHQDAAAAFQLVLEERALQLCEVLRRRSQARHLVVAGGVALNSVMNGRIVRESGFDDLYVMPAAGDNGTSIGAAFYVENVVLGRARRFVHLDPFVGNAYDDDAIARVLRQCKLPAVRRDDVIAATADRLHAGRIIGWFQGRMEIGPRALGNRSILANPAIPDMKARINAEVKHREAYRPFAPSTIVEARSTYFEMAVEAPFMLKVCAVRPDKREVIPAVTHVDGSARVQTVRREVNPRYYDLIRSLGERSGVPVVLNTSFNIMGEPMIESPIDAIRCFFSTGLDSLVIGDHVIDKAPFPDPGGS